MIFPPCTVAKSVLGSVGITIVSIIRMTIARIEMLQAPLKYS